MNANQNNQVILADDFRGYLFKDQMADAIHSYRSMENIYASAIREIATKLEILNDEFKYNMDRNPIHSIKTRVKSPQSIMDKVLKKECELSIESSRANLTDIAGIRVICSYIDDIYMIADLLTAQDDIGLIRVTDYIKNPKPNGYRSLHLIVTVPVFLSTHTEIVTAEIQIRTIAMDFWATLEHELAYKLTTEKSIHTRQELRDCADAINETDMRMQKLYNQTILLRKP